MQNMSSNTTMADHQQECMPHPHDGIAFQPFLGIQSVWHRGQLAAAIVLLCALYSFAVLRAVKPGLPRLLLGLPVLAGIHAVPLLFHPVLEPLATISATFLAVRLTSGKVGIKKVLSSGSTGSLARSFSIMLMMAPTCRRMCVMPPTEFDLVWVLMGVNERWTGCGV
jgi:hypothetical protein